MYPCNNMHQNGSQGDYMQANNKFCVHLLKIKQITTDNKGQRPRQVNYRTDQTDTLPKLILQADV